MSVQAMTPSPMPSGQNDMAHLRASAWCEKAAVVGVVSLLHALVFVIYGLQPEAPTVMVSEMAVSLAAIQAVQTTVVPQPKLKPREPEMEPESAPAETPAVKQEAPAAPQTETAAAAPVMLDTEPDYKADYLNNPRPPYPMVAKRMGYQGKVVLNVEVLADGRAGQVLLHKGSGYDILDKASIQTVKSWRFTPARHLGQPVTQWFLVPVKFSLEEGNS